MVRWITRIVGVILALIVLAIGAVLLMPADRVAQVAADQIRSATGRDVTLSGDVSMTLWPVLGASVGGLEVGNADWSDQGPMLTAQNAAIGIDAKALLTGAIRITNIEAQSPTIRLESRADGRASWQFTDASGAAQIETETSPERAAQAFSIARLQISDATLIYDAEGSDLVSYSGVDLDLDWPDPESAAQINAVLRPSGTPVVVAATIDTFSAFLSGSIRPVDVTLSNDAGTASLVGRAGISGDVAGAVRLNTSDTGAFLHALGLPRVDLPNGLGRAIDMSTELTLTQDRQLALRDVSADLGGNRLTGAADVSLNGIPQINAQLSAGALDLRNAIGASTGSSQPEGNNGAGWSKAAIDASGLAAFNGDIALRADSIDFGSLKLGLTRTLLRNDRSRMVFELREVAAYDGTISGEFVMNNRNGLSVGGSMAGRGLQMGGMLQDLAGISQLDGAAEADVQFLGVGQSVDAIMQSLSGKGAIRVGRGLIKGIDLDRLMRSGSTGGGTTVFDSLGATFTMDSGNLRNEDLLLTLQNYEARGQGRIGLGAQDIDYLFTPKALRANEGKGIAIPVRVRGPWSGPKILPDLEAAIDLNFAAEKKRVEEKVKNEVQRAVERELGVTVEDGQSVEDAIEKKLEDEVGRKLRSLFD